MGRFFRYPRAHVKAKGGGGPKFESVVNWFIFRPIAKGWCTLVDVKEKLTILDLLKMHNALDELEYIEEYQMEQAKAK